ncbi:probable RNA-binding protein 19 [Pecten maximus]|uniref:probable RNA-binding protein 19 n=1 Tax=Pecten maximus TaxID=6579 RepID=UPI0014581239|nr:probable RNA-binding protein 19 [Pecten maximus]
MSRIIIKNLPNKIKEERLRSIFGKNGLITDCSMKFTKDGRFRKFAFIGFRSDEEAQHAIGHFNETFIDTSKITVEVASDLGDARKPRSWSRYAADSSAYQKTKASKVKEAEVAGHGRDEKVTPKQKKEKKKTAKEKALEEMLGDLKDDPGFEEFMAAHKRTGKKTVWDNDADVIMPQAQKDKSSDEEDEDEDPMDEDTSEDNEEDVEENEEDVEEKKKIKEVKIIEEKDKTATKADLSDMEYLKSKMSKKQLLSDSSSDEDEEESDSDENEEESDEGKEDKSDDDKVDSKKSQKKMDSKATKSKKKEEASKSTQKKVNDPGLVVKMKGLHVSSGEKAIKEFFKPLHLTSIRIPRNAKKKPLYGIAYVSFKNEKDIEEAMKKNKNFIGGKRIFLKKCTQAEQGAPVQWEDVPRPWELKSKEEDDEEETIAESGRIFVRNLTYTCTEEDLHQLFEKYGPVSEIHLPIDSLTKKMKGFAIVTYLMPEHAVKAFTELDGTTFMGRLMHLIPAKTKKEDEVTASEGSSYKTKKQEKQKALAGSSHNWNSLFLGANTVADVLAEKYSTEKSHILDAQAKQSLGVRMALGETQIVAETRDFLLEEGVALDSFSQPSAARSKSVILVKNLPAGTKSVELRDLFSKHGTVGRVILPPSGVTAIVEYLEPTEAKTGFRRLAYSKFQHVPLYLEWAPMEVFKAPATVPTVKEGEEKQQRTDSDSKVEKMETNKEEEVKQKEEEEEEEEEEVSESGATLFVKNLNFESREDDLKKKFKKCGKIKSVSVAKKKDMKNPGSYLSLGYGFVEYYEKASADKALKTLQHTDLDGHTLELKVSHRQVGTTEVKSTKKKAKSIKQKTSKILVRNIPFEAKRKEVFELFKTFGELKSVRLPTKLSGSGTHRGFGFVDFLTKQDAKRAFEALCHSTHLYGRRLVLEWAEDAEDLQELRRKTSEHFHEDSPMSKRVKRSAIMDTLEMSHKGS